MWPFLLSSSHLNTYELLTARSPSQRDFGEKTGRSLPLLSYETNDGSVKAHVAHGPLTCYDRKSKTYIDGIKSMIDKKAQWEDVEKRMGRITDRLGMPIDAGIMDVCVALVANNVNTTFSCEGHIDTVSVSKGGQGG